MEGGTDSVEYDVYTDAHEDDEYPFILILIL